MRAKGREFLKSLCNRLGNGGQAVVETALAVAVLTPLLFWIMHFYEYYDLRVKTRQALRYAAWERTAYRDVNLPQFAADLAAYAGRDTRGGGRIDRNVDRLYTRPEKSYKKIEDEITNPADYRFFPNPPTETRRDFPVKTLTIDRLIHLDMGSFLKNAMVDLRIAGLRQYVDWDALPFLFGDFQSPDVAQGQFPDLGLLKKMKLATLLAYLRVYPRGTVSSIIEVQKDPPVRLIPPMLYPTWRELFGFVRDRQQYHLITETWMARDREHAEEGVRNLWMMGIPNHASELIRGVDVETGFLRDRKLVGMDFGDVPPSPIDEFDKVKSKPVRPPRIFDLPIPF